MKAHRGFTLFDVVITMGIAALVMGMAAPSFTDLVLDIKLRETARTLTEARHYAQMEAWQRQIPVQVCPMGIPNQGKGGVTACDGDETGLAIFTDQDRDGSLDLYDGDVLIRYIDKYRTEDMQITAWTWWSWVAKFETWTFEPWVVPSYGGSGQANAETDEWNLMVCDQRQSELHVVWASVDESRDGLLKNESWYSCPMAAPYHS